MKHVMKAFSALVLTTAFVFASKAEATTSVQLDLGYRSDDLKWNRRIPETIRLNTKTHLNFKDLEIFQIGGKLKSVCGECVYYRIEGHYGWVLDGTLRERDQIAKPSEVPLSQATQTCVITPDFFNDVDDKYVADFNIGFGYPIEQCWCPNIQIIPAIGFEYDTIRLNAKNHQRIHDEIGSSELCEFGLNSLSSSNKRKNHFRTTVWGPWIGLDFAFCHQDCWNVYGEFQFQFARARRERHSHMGLDDIDRHRRSKTTYGFSAKIGSLYFFRCNYFLDGNLYYKRWWSDERHDHLTWRSLGVNVGLGYAF